MISKKDNFYVILPSNSCPITQPNNHASSYIVDWETGFSLNEPWEVALTDFSVMSTLTNDQGASKIDYIHLIEKKEQVVVHVLPTAITITNKNDDFVSVSYKPHGVIEIKCLSSSFSIVFNSILEANYFGFTRRVTRSETNIKFSDSPVYLKKLYAMLQKRFPEGSMNEISPIQFSFQIQYPDIEQAHDSIVFNEHLLFTSSKILCEFFNQHCSYLFEEFKVDQNEKIEFRLKAVIDSITFSEKLKKLLGFERSTFSHNGGVVRKANHKLALENKFDRMFIYSSIVEAMHVGSVQVPLLRAIWIESKYNSGEVVNENIDQLMYLPVSSTSINNIEIEIRNDAGKLINFPFGSKTSLTLHFRKIK